MLLTINQLTEVITETPLPCSRCNGSGYLQEFRHIQSGACFKCDGKGTSLKTEVTTKEVVTEYTINAEIMEDGEDFEDMLKRHEQKKESAKQEVEKAEKYAKEIDELATKMATDENGGFDLFVYFDALNAVDSSFPTPA